MLKTRYPIPVIDIFAGPGGLSEGFASVRPTKDRPAFDIVLSIEKDRFAHATLELRAFFRHLSSTGDAYDYFRYLRGTEQKDGIDRESLFSLHPESARAARSRAWHQELAQHNRAEISERISAVLGTYPPGTPWVLLGGPPCQAYSVAGRSRMRRIMGSRFEQDRRHTLYQEYLAILAAHRPHIFVMENVKGLLSSQVQSERTFDLMLPDLRGAAGPHSYTLFSFAKSVMSAPRAREAVPGTESDLKPEDFVIHCERYGVPQMRHRVIILGVRSDLLTGVPDFTPGTLRKRGRPIPVRRVLKGLPRLRSGLTRAADTPDAWRTVLQEAGNAAWLPRLDGDKAPLLIRKIKSVIGCIRLPSADRGGQFVPVDRVSVGYEPRWYLDQRLHGVCNHEARPHMASDLHRYLFAACYAAIHHRTAKLGGFPGDLLPKHANVSRALRHGMFNDRFRVQVGGRPATTITCHLAKDGHYNIHFDPAQCRSLTVREAARIQTFPDNYFFEGPRTQQYVQVGNAVPPLLARQLGVIVLDVLGKLQR